MAHGNIRYVCVYYCLRSTEEGVLLKLAEGLIVLYTPRWQYDCILSEKETENIYPSWTHLYPQQKVADWPLYSNLVQGELALYSNLVQEEFVCRTQPLTPSGSSLTISVAKECCTKSSAVPRKHCYEFLLRSKAVRFGRDLTSATEHDKNITG